MLGSRGRAVFTESPISVEHIGRLQRMHLSKQAAWEEREFLDAMMRSEVVVDERSAWRIDHFKWSWHNRWSTLGNLINKGKLDIVLSLMTVSLLSDWEYESMEELVDEAELEADKVCQLDVWVEDNFTKFVWLYDVSPHIREISEIVAGGPVSGFTTKGRSRPAGSDGATSCLHRP